MIEVTTTPQVPLDFLSASIQKMQKFQPFQDLVMAGLVGTDADDDAPLSEKLSKAWLFQGLAEPAGVPYRDPEGSSTGVVVLMEPPEWDSNRHNTMRFPSLRMLVYMDSSRDETGAPILPDAEAKAKHVSRVLDRCFHLPSHQPQDRRWPGPYRVHSSVRRGGMEIDIVPGTEGLVKRCVQNYEATMD